MAIKHRVDLDLTPGQYLLTGSARPFALCDIPDVLPGRAETIELWPLSQGELAGQPDSFIDGVVEHGVDLDVLPVSLVVPANLSNSLTVPALGELARQLGWASEPVPLHHYRDGYEVDAVLEHASGDVVAIEVKATETVHADDFRGIRHLARRLGDRLVAGIVLYAGSTPLPFGDRLRAWPISGLWTTRA
ncbi:MAG: DUF4143 domain-containing protein [Dermatophilaceae bacterium]